MDYTFLLLVYVATLNLFLIKCGKEKMLGNQRAIKGTVMLHLSALWAHVFRIQKKGDIRVEFIFSYSTFLSRSHYAF